MSIKPSDLFTVADGMTPGVEMFDRSAISRFYYCAHHEAIEFLRSKGITALDVEDPRTGTRLSRHQAVVFHLRKVDQDAGDDLNDLRERRNRADYEIAQTIPAKDRDEVRQLLQDLRRRVFRTQ